MSKKKKDSYLYNFYNKDDGDGFPILIEVDGYPVQVGINVVILPCLHIVPSKDGHGKVTVIGSNSFIGRNVTLDEGAIIPERTIIKGEQPTPNTTPFAQAHLVFDDFGRTKENNAATLAFYKRVPAHHVSLMVNRGENTEEAVRLARNAIDARHIGLHLNLTEGIPLSHMISEKWYSVNKPGSLGKTLVSRRAAFFLTRKEKRLILDEVEQQIKQFRSYGFKPQYIDSHGNILFQLPLARLISPVLIREGFTYIRVPRTENNRHKIYSFFFMRRVKRLFQNRFHGVDYFINASDIAKSDISKYKGKTIEIMIHPYMKNGREINRRDIDLPVLNALLEALNIGIASDQELR